MKALLKVMRYIKLCPCQGLHFPSTTTLSLSTYCDSDWAACPITRRSVTALKLASNPVNHARTKHIEIDYHFVRDKIKDQQILPSYIPTKYQAADVFTKGLPKQLLETRNQFRQVVQQTGVKCYNCNGFEHMAKECKAGKRVKDSRYHKEKMLLAKREEAGGKLSAEEHDWLIDSDGEENDLELEGHYIYMTKIADTMSSFDTEPLEHVQSTSEYNLFANKRHHFEQPESINDTYVMEKDDNNVISDS
ncbi:putative ribonuclease H-like domain-containing protein [Tanacetum coccineum]